MASLLSSVVVHDLYTNIHEQCICVRVHHQQHVCIIDRGSRAIPSCISPGRQRYTLLDGHCLHYSRYCTDIGTECSLWIEKLWPNSRDVLIQIISVAWSSLRNYLWIMHTFLRWVVMRLILWLNLCVLSNFEKCLVCTVVKFINYLLMTLNISSRYIIIRKWRNRIGWNQVTYCCSKMHFWFWFWVMIFCLKKAGQIKYCAI